MPFSIPKLRPEVYPFLVKGLRFQMFEHHRPLVKLLYPYFAHNENILVVSEPCTGKRPAFHDIYCLLTNRGKRVVIISNWPFNLPGAVRPKEFVFSEPYDHIICDCSLSTEFLRALVAEYGSTSHLSLFIDYSSLEDYKPDYCSAVAYDRSRPHWYKILIDAVAQNLGLKVPGMEEKYTVICMRPKMQTVRFVFAMNEDLKMPAIKVMNCPPCSVVYRTKGRRITLRNCVYIDKIPPYFKCTRVILGDVDFKVLEWLLLRFSDIVVVYSMEDFPHISHIVAIFDKYGIPVPEHIRILASHKPQ